MEPLWVATTEDILPQKMVDVLEETVDEAGSDDEEIHFEEFDDYDNESDIEYKLKLLCLNSRDITDIESAQYILSWQMVAVFREARIA